MTSFTGSPRLSTACLSTASISSAVSPGRKAEWAISREASSISETK